jgi:two-component system, NarL family, invasion response regulator UvrY
MRGKKILLADDHSAIRTGVKHILSGAFPDFEFGEATNAHEVFQLIASQKWDILILDINLPGRNGIEILNELKSNTIALPVLVFSMYGEAQVAVRALRLGAFGFLTKDAADKELIHAVQQILEGHKYITLAVAERLVSTIENPSQLAPHESLSDREFQTMIMIASGRTISDIAEELSLSISTINTYRARIIEKMNLKNNAELISYALRHQLI